MAVEPKMNGDPILFQRSGFEDISWWSVTVIIRLFLTNLADFSMD
jgi:hypothetical protein